MNLFGLEVRNLRRRDGIGLESQRIDFFGLAEKLTHEVISSSFCNCQHQNLCSQDL